MKSNSSYPKLIDKQVFLSMAVCAIIGLTVLAFRFKNYEPCSPVEISYKQGPIYTGELVQFKAITKNSKSLLWNFGDRSEAKQSDENPTHTFMKPGVYRIGVTSGKGCYASETIEILKAPSVLDKSSLPQFTGPLTVEVGTPANFVDSTPNAEKWEWRFGESNGVDATQQKVRYTFRTPGPKKVILLVNDRMQGELMVLVTPQSYNRNQTPSPRRRPRIQAPNRTGAGSPFELPEDLTLLDSNVPEVTLEQLQGLLKGMVEGERTAADLTAYFCDNLNKPINLNGEQMNIDELYKELRSIRRDERIRDLQIEFEKDSDTNCIKSMKIKLRRRFLGL